MENREILLSEQSHNATADILNSSDFISGKEENNAQLALLETEVSATDLDLLQVTEFTPSTSGFEILFNKAIPDSAIDLASSKDSVLLKDQAGNFLDGSIIFQDGFTGFTFVKTGDPLAPGSYTINLESGESGIVNLDGDNDDRAGGDYNVNFIVVDNQARILNLADLTLAPGEFVSSSAESRDLNISIDNGTELSQIKFEVEYNPDLLSINNFQLAENLPEDWQLQTNTTAPGIAELTLNGSTPLAGGEQNLISIAAEVPKNAQYGATQILQLKNVQLNNGNLIGEGDSAIHQVAMQGDLSGDRTLSNFDAYLIAQASTGLISDSVAHPDVDLTIMGDLNGDGELSTFDAYQALQLQKELPEINVDTLDSRVILDDGARITGTVSGNNSQINEAYYSLSNSNEIIEISLGENGAFNLDLGVNLPENSVFTLQLTAIDNAGKSNYSEIEVVVPLTTDSGLQYVDLQVGDGTTPTVGQLVTVNYTGFLEDGTVFDSSRERNTPFSFNIGEGRVIQGWDEGLATMSVGSNRLLIIPADLAYGESGIPDVIPPNATLIFDVELLEIEPSL